MIGVQRRRGAGNKYIILDKSCWQTTPCGSVVESQSTPCGSVVDEQTTPSHSVVDKESTLPHGVEGFKSFKNTHTLSASVEAFARFWAAAPKQMRKAKLDAQKAWAQLNPSSELVEYIIAALEAQKLTDLWKRDIGIPYAARWLRGRRWEDEVDAPPSTKPGEQEAPAPAKAYRYFTDQRGRKCVAPVAREPDPLPWVTTTLEEALATPIEQAERRNTS
jgi:hypothetical protein